METAPEIDIEKCTGCGDCVLHCPAGAVEVVDGKIRLIDPDACTYCTDCEEICPSGAISCPYEIVIEVDKPK